MSAKVSATEILFASISLQNLFFHFFSTTGRDTSVNCSGKLTTGFSLTDLKLPGAAELTREMELQQSSTAALIATTRNMLKSASAGKSLKPSSEFDVGGSLKKQSSEPSSQFDMKSAKPFSDFDVGGNSDKQLSDVAAYFNVKPV